jgi:hypothetical protein
VGIREKARKIEREREKERGRRNPEQYPSILITLPFHSKNCFRNRVGKEPNINILFY